jgi:hypothetical protein
MGLDKVAGVFSRLFIVGFFAPSFLSVFLLSRLLSPDMLPHEYVDAKGGSQILAVGAAALFLALVLSGLQAPIKLAYEGYVLEELTRVPLLAGLHRASLGRQLRRYEQLRVVRDTRSASRERTLAAQRLERWFPRNREALTPTRYGNVVGAFMQYPRARYGLDGRATWTRVELLLSDRQQDLVSSARTDVDFFLNGALGSLLVAVFVAIDDMTHPPVSWGSLWLLLPVVIAYLSYRLATNAAERWGDEIRACFDLCRNPLFLATGVRIPTTRDAELTSGRAVNRLFLYSEPLPDELRLPAPDDK